MTELSRDATTNETPKSTRPFSALRAPATGWIVASVFFAVFGLLAVIATTARKTFSALEADSAQRSQISAALVALSNLRTHLVDAETGQRGFLYTGRTSYLAPYLTAREALRRDTNDLRNLVGTLPELDTALIRAEPVIHGKMAELDSTIVLDSTGHGDLARGMVGTDRGKVLMDSLRKTIAATERRLMLLRDARAQHVLELSAQARSTIGIGMFVGAIALLAAGLVIRGQLAARGRAAQDIQDREQLLEGILEAIPLGVIVYDAGGMPIRSNDKTARILGQQVAGGTQVDELTDKYRPGVPLSDAPEYQSLQGISIYRDDLEITTAAGTIPLEVWSAPIWNSDGKVMNAVTLFNDISRRKADQQRIEALNNELGQRVRELEVITRELDAFSHSVSHDLRAPLRAIDGFSRMVIEDYSATLPADGQRKLQVVRERTQRMGHLIDDLLRLSRVGRSAIRSEMVDMNALVVQALLEIQQANNGERSAATIEVGTLPPTRGDSELLLLVWVNLLSNAIKYSAKSETPTVRVTGDVVDGERVYSVADNGVGFDMAYANKLFGIFQRLHRLDDFEGTGVGLAIVQRIISRHGGRIWASAEVTKGATFSFAFPAGGT